MIGDIKIETIDGKEYEITKQGVSFCIDVRSAFLTMLRNSGVSFDADLSEKEFLDIMMLGLYGDLVKRVKDIIIGCVTSPKFDHKSYEEKLDHSTVSRLFLHVYNFHFGEADKKKEDQKESPTTATT